MNQALRMVFDSTRNFLAPLKALDVEPKICFFELLGADLIEVIVDVLSAIIFIILIIWFPTRFELK